MLELVLGAGSMFLESLLAAMGVHLSLRSPASPARRLWLATFVVCGALSVVLTGLATLHSANVRAQLRSDSAILRGDLAKARERQVSPKTLEDLAERSQTQPDEPAEKIAGAAAARIDQLSQEVGALESRLAKYVRPPRSLTVEQQEALPDLLRQGGTCELGVRYSRDDSESGEYAGALARLIQQGGWKLRPPQFLVQEKEAPGLWVMVHSQEDAPVCAKVLLASLNALGIGANDVEVHALQPGTFDLLIGAP
jgi:hypothetical protein